MTEYWPIQQDEQFPWTLICLELKERVENFAQDYIRPGRGGLEGAVEQLATGSLRREVQLGYDLERQDDRIVLLLFVGWPKSHTPAQQLEETRIALKSVEDLLRGEPRVTNLMLANSWIGASSHRIVDICVVRGDANVVNDSLLAWSGELMWHATSGESDMENEEELQTISRGITPIDQADGSRTLTTIMACEDGPHRDRFKDPKQESYGGCTLYEDYHVKPMRRAKEQGADVQTPYYTAIDGDSDLRQYAKQLLTNYHSLLPFSIQASSKRSSGLVSE